MNRIIASTVAVVMLAVAVSASGYGSNSGSSYGSGSNSGSSYGSGSNSGSSYGSGSNSGSSYGSGSGSGYGSASSYVARPAYVPIYPQPQYYNYQPGFQHTPNGVAAVYRNDQRQEYVNNVAYTIGTGLGTAPWYGVPGTNQAFGFGNQGSYGNQGGYGNQGSSSYGSQTGYGNNGGSAY